MSAKIIYERFLWFHVQVIQGRFPNATSLAERFEISVKTSQRDIEFMRNRLHAPLRYTPARRGYFYASDSYQLPGFWLKEDELVSLLLSARLAAAIPDSGVKIALQRFLDQILTLHTPPDSLSVDSLSRKVSLKNIEYCHTDENIFHEVLDALLYNRPIAIDYYSPHNNETTARDILPLHLLHYMGTWHIIAHCALKDGLRDFVLSRIRFVKPSTCTMPRREFTASIKEYIRQYFGIMTGSESIIVCLRFSEAVSPWIAGQVWHPTQQMYWNDDQTLCLTFPVADLREVKREIMKYGAQVEVVAPDNLREEIKEEIEKMKNIYS